MTQLDDRIEPHSPLAEGVSAQVDTTNEIRITTPEKVCGMGHPMKRKEDPRFIQGKGRYVDDVKLPGMLYMDIVRSPYAHAKIKKIDASEALACGLVSGVVAPEALLEAARTLARRIAANPTGAVRMAKRLMREARHAQLASVLELSAAFQAIAHHTDAHEQSLRHLASRGDTR